MGYYWQGLPPFIIQWSKGLLPDGSTAVETGTFQGDTSLLLAGEFGSCTTIERHDGLFREAQERFRQDPRVTVLHGSSRELLREAMPQAGVGCFFWLDAHGLYEHAGPDQEENPLLAEIETITSVRGDSASVIVIDDARGMGTQPGWPPLTEIFHSLDQGGFSVVIVDDCLVAAPKALNPDFHALYRAARTVEVPAVFHVWPQIRTLVSMRARSDRAVTASRRFLKRH